MENINSKQENVSNEEKKNNVEDEDDEDDDFWECNTGCKISGKSKTLNVCTCPPDTFDCMARAQIDCPLDDPWHYDYSGCPSCSIKGADSWVRGTGCKVSLTSKAVSVCTCPPGTTGCMVKAYLDCPFENPMHYICSNGCPSCSSEEIHAKNACEL